MDDERLKKAWQNSNDSSADNDLMRAATSRDILNGKRRTALMRLADRYRRFYILAFIFAILSGVWANNPIFDNEIRYPLTIFMVCYFLLCAVMDYYLCQKVRDIDVQTMPTAEVIKRAMLCRKRHLQFIIVLIPLAIVLIGMIGWGFRDNMEFIISMTVGGLTGGAIGIVKFREFMHDYRVISDDAD